MTTVLITGSSTGFGLVTAKAFAQRGWNVVATMRTPAADHELAALPNVFVTQLDVQDRASIDAAIAAALQRFGTIDALVNNAGYGLFGVFEETPREQIEQQFAVNVFGVMDVTRAVLPHMRERRRGVIVNISSGAGVFTLPGASSYCASKFALEGWSEAMSYELASQGITLKIVEPGGVLSTQFGARSMHEASRATALPAYAAFTASTLAIMSELRGARLATAEHVAEVIVNATTDGSDQLRYVATEDIAPLIHARRETNEQAYMTFMRDRFRR